MKLLDIPARLYVRISKVSERSDRFRFPFHCSINDEKLYSNTSEGEWIQVEKLIGPIPEQAKSVTVGNEDVSVIKCSFYEDGEECSIIAVSNGTGNILGSKSYLQKYVLPYMWIFGACAILIVVLVNGAVPGGLIL